MPKLSILRHRIILGQTLDLILNQVASIHQPQKLFQFYLIDEIKYEAIHRRGQSDLGIVMSIGLNKSTPPEWYELLLSHKATHNFFFYLYKKTVEIEPYHCLLPDFEYYEMYIDVYEYIYIM